jgi:DNA mismatch repair protein MutS2
MLSEKSLHTLELDAILQKLANCAVSEAAKEKCLALQPSADLDSVRELLSQTSAAAQLMTLKSTPSFQDLHDVAQPLQRAERGGSLNPKELLRIAGVLRCTRMVKNYYDSDPVGGCLDGFFFALSPNKYLEDRIYTAIVSEEEISDQASPTLRDIRRHMRQQSAKVRESLQKIISSPAYAKYLQEPVITMRQGRYVVPVKSEHKNDIAGLVHDVSSSGGTFFIEPMQAVNANNALRELEGEEQKEIERILAELSSETASYREALQESFAALTDLDAIFARAKLSYQMKAMEPAVTDNGQLTLVRARHPLIDPKTVVPTSVRLGSDFDTLVITGPNTGGKTVTLKTIGLLTLMAECGLHIPAEEGSSISTFDDIFADIGDEQSIEQSLSTFSSHMKNIVEIINACDSRSLVLFDELGAGTDPAEGAALAIAVIEFCRKMGARVAATTHYAELKLYAMRNTGVSNASCEFDVETLQPTYRLLIGVPGKSNAFAISRRLGLPEDIIQEAGGLVDKNVQDFEDVLTQLEEQRKEMERAKLEAEQLRRATEDTKKKSDEYYAQIQRERAKAKEQAQLEAQHIVADARRAADEVYRELADLRKQMRNPQDIPSFNARQSELRRKLNEAERNTVIQTPEQTRPKPSRDPRPGDTVELLGLGNKATVLAVNKDGSYQLQAGIMKINAKPEEIYLLEHEEQKKVKKYIEKATREMRNLSVAPEIDLRGMTADEAIGVLDLFLDSAMMANLPSVRIIHGKGTGALRKAVQEHLRHCRGVKEFRLGVYGEGEDGVTIATLAK